MHDFAIIFDMDGVIIDSNPTHKIALDQFCKKYGYSLSEEELKSKIYGRTNMEWIPNLFNKSKLTTEEIKQYEEEKESLFRELFAPIIQPVKGLENFLKLLEKKGIKKAIATSAPGENVDFVLEKTGLRKYFHTILDESSIQNGKPHPEVYLKTTNALKMLSSKCIVIEDSLSGIESAKSAGCKVIGITTTHSTEELKHTDLVINDFDELNVEKLLTLVEG